MQYVINKKLPPVPIGDPPQKNALRFLQTVSGSLSLAMAISSQMRCVSIGLGSSARAMIGAQVETPIRSVAVALREF